MKWGQHLPAAAAEPVLPAAGSRRAGVVNEAVRYARAVRRAYRSLRHCAAAPLLRIRLGVGLQPLSDRWFARGLPVHRYYVEQFLAANGSDIQGHCLEFQEDSYTSRFSRGGVTRVDVLHKEMDTHGPRATIHADLTGDNGIPSAMFDCIICTYVLHLVEGDLDRFTKELHRILRPGGVLFVAVPNITIAYPEFVEFLRFTPRGLARLLAHAFGAGNVHTSSYGNSLTCAGELRGLATPDFTRAEVDYNDPRFGLVTCARAVKGRVD